MIEPQVLVRSLVFVGGGHAHVHALKEIGMKPIPGVQVMLITRDVDTPYSGMLPGHIAGHYTKEECHIDLQKMARFAGVDLVHTEAVGIDLRKRLIHCKDGRPPIRYDVLSIDIGSTPKFVQSKDPSDLKRVTRVKPIDSFSARWDSIVERLLGTKEQQQQKRKDGGESREETMAAPLSRDSRSKTIVVVGGGAGGVELALSIQYRLKQLFAEAGRDPAELEVVVVNRGETILSSHNRGVQKIFRKVLSDRGIKVYTGKDVVDVKDPPEGLEGVMGTGTLFCSDGTEIPFVEAIWCTSSGAAGWLRDTGLDLTDDGFIKVNDFLESTNTPGVFAVGDCAHMINHPRPKAGVFAVRQGPPLADNLRRMLEGFPMKGFKPQKAFMGLISTGDTNAVISLRNLAWESIRLWRWKDYIDRTWMKKYKELPFMDPAKPQDKNVPSPHLPPSIVTAGPEAVDAAQHALMRCGGCGSKVGAAVLQRVLKRLGVGEEIGGGLDDAAIVAPPQEPGTLTVHTVDFFRSFVTDPYMFGRIAANHALSDVHAMGADPTTALAIVTVPFGGEAQVEGTLEQLLAGALRTLREAECLLVGGHTCEGAEIALGLSVNGVARGGIRSLLGKGGAEAGDALVLTKAVGTGAILAAEMRGRANSRWVQSAVHSMLQSNGPAAKVLRDHGARACTDVTGFGVAGHLAEMLRAAPLRNAGRSEAMAANGEVEEKSKDTGEVPPITAEIDLGLLPVLPGAVEVVEEGVVSTLQGQNERDNAALVAEGKSDLKAEMEERRQDARFRLLFDPQTAGGLLAAVPSDRAQACVAALRGDGFESSRIIGTVKESTHGERAGHIQVIPAAASS